MNDLTTYQRILKLRSIRTYRDEPLSEEDLDAILEAARWTGSAKNKQNWKFVVIRDQKQKDRLTSAGEWAVPAQQAPCAIAIVNLANGYEFDVGRAAQNIMLAADAIGVVSCPVTLHDGDKAAEVLGLPESASVRYAIALGYPTGHTVSLPSSGGGRKSREEVVSYEHY